MNRRERRATDQRRAPSGVSPAADGGSRFAEAVAHHQAGRLAEAETLYRRVLAKQPRHADALHLLGVIAHQTGQHAVAVDLIGRAIAIDGDVGLYHSNRGNALRALGKLADAADEFRAALARRPDHPLDLCNLGAALHDQRQFDAALPYLEKAVALAPTLAEGHNNLGLVLDRLGRPEAAIAHFETAIAQRPGYAEAHNNLAGTLKESGALDAAARQYRIAIALRPNLAEAHHNLAVVLKRQGKLEEAIARARRAIDLAPGLPEAHDNLGAALADQDQLDAAADQFRAAIALRPGYAEARDNLGTVLLQQGCSEEAIASFRAAIAEKPDFANAHHNLAMALLARGAFADGWREYEWRFQTAQFAPSRREFSRPRWRGEPAEGRTLLIHAEQGFGDTIQFGRYARVAGDAGWRVILQVQAPLVRLLKTLSGVDRVLAPDEPVDDFDCHCPMLSLPLAVGTTMETIPAAPSYVSADEDQAADWRARLAALDGAAFRIGLCWAGNPAISTDRRRSLPPDRLAPLFDVPAIQFISLQKTGPAPPAGAPIHDFMTEMHDFADTAALVMALDLVISVDTAVAHLAAALGKPVFLLNRFDQEWRWLSGRADSPWYPTLRIFRQDRPGDWDSVMGAVAAALRAGADRAAHPGS